MEIQQGFTLYNKYNIKESIPLKMRLSPRLATPLCFVGEIILFFSHRFMGRSYFILTNRFLFYNMRTP